MQSKLERALEPRALDWWRGALARLAEEGERVVPELFPALVRRLGSAPLGGGLYSLETGNERPARVDLDAWRLADTAGWLLLTATSTGSNALVDLYLHGDMEERIVALRCAALAPLTDQTVRLLAEVQRTNVESHFIAGACDSNLPARAVEHADFGIDGFNRLVLKAAFLGKSVHRLLEVETRANPELSRMLMDLASEREAAGRVVWPGTNILISYAPIDGTAARLVGGIEHGDDIQRLSAAEGLAVLKSKDLAPYVRERLAREPRQEIRAALERALRS